MYTNIIVVCYNIFNRLTREAKHMITSIDTEKMLATVEIHRAGSTSNVIMWWALSKNTAEYYAIQNNAKVVTVTIDLPIRKLVKAKHGGYMVELASNSPYICGKGGLYSIYGKEVKEEDMSEWLDVPLSNVLCPSEELIPVGIDTQVNLCMGQQWLF